MELQMTQAWRELCELSSGFSELHRGSGILQQRAGETRDVGEQCLSSSLHNQFITFYRKTSITSRVIATSAFKSGFCITSLVVAMRRVAVPIEGFWGLPADVDGVGAWESRLRCPGSPRTNQLQPKTPKAI